MEIQTAITLLTVIVGLLTLVIVALLAALIVFAVKLTKLIASVEDVARNVSEATAWFTPAKVLGTIVKLFNK